MTHTKWSETNTKHLKQTPYILQIVNLRLPNDLKCIPKHLKRIQYFPYIIVPKQQFLQIWDPDFLKYKNSNLFLSCGFYLRLNSIPKHLKRTQNFPLLPKDAKCLTNDRMLLLVNPPPIFQYCQFSEFLFDYADLTS